MASHNRRRSSIDRATVQSVLNSGDSGQPLGSPSPHVGDSPNREHFAMAPPARPSIDKPRPLSYTPRNPNRLSLSLPVATGTSTNDSARPTPQSSNVSSFPPTPSDVPVPSPHDPNGFLVALASQERRVLELKEELYKAETDLERLKIKWANHEKTRKRAEIRHIEPLRPLPQPTADGGRSSEDGEGTTRQSVEIDRRRAILSHVPKEPRRKVFSGGHHRTLSLLSPDRSHYARPFPAVGESDSGSASDASGNFPRNTTMPDTSMGMTKVNSNRARHSYQGGVTHGAKQIAEDVKAGLWTFLEDLRQATVGEEATASTPRTVNEIAHTGPRKKISKTSLIVHDRGGGRSPVGSSTPRTWDSLTGSQIGLGLGLGISNGKNPLLSDSQTKASVSSKQKATVPLSLAPPIDDLDDNWSNWDSPAPKSPRWSGSTDISSPATPSHTADEGRPVK